MKWQSRLLTNEMLGLDGTCAGVDLPAQVRAMIAQQLETWPLLSKATASLAAVEYREFEVNESRVMTQFNPARIVSTAAKVDAASIQARPCFLCAENLPAEEKGIEFGANYVVLCNPFPVLKNHLVISHRDHTPQAIADKFTDFLALTAAIGSEYFTLYNGPACGASAPDHHHFQACSRDNIPLFAEVETWPQFELAQSEGFRAFTLRDYRLNALIARGTDQAKIATWFQAVYTQLAHLTNTTNEPMLNLVATFDAHGWTVYVLPRAKHRPESYFAAPEQQLIVSPAGIDLAGILVVPNPIHFARITALDIAKIYSEVTLEFGAESFWLRLD